jgi:hypothetical protein
MTNVVIWKKTGEEAIHVAADSRVTNPRKVTEQATKILPLKVSVHEQVRHVDWPWQPKWQLQLGYCYSGAVVPALLTHCAVQTILGNLGPCPTRLPTLKQVAALIAHISRQYIVDAAQVYPISSPPVCDLVVFGYSGYEGELAGYRVKPRVDAQSFTQEIEPIDLSPGTVTVLGTDTENLRLEINALVDGKDANYCEMEPRLALANRIAAETHSTVGGVLQCAVLKHGTLETFTIDAWASGRTLLGFNLDELEPLVGCPVLVRKNLFSSNDRSD